MTEQLQDQVHHDPTVQFEHWYREAERLETSNPNAAALASADEQGTPSLRMVLLKQWDEQGFVFYTNRDSRKGRELCNNPRAALCLYWKSLERQVRIEGAVDEVSAAEAERYFHSRPRDSQLGAWASKQSKPLEQLSVLEQRFAYFAERWPDGIVPCPPHWVGFRLCPSMIEFWCQRQFRLHERVVYRRRLGPKDVLPVSSQDMPLKEDVSDGPWVRHRLFP